MRKSPPPRIQWRVTERRGLVQYPAEYWVCVCVGYLLQHGPQLDALLLQKNSLRKWMEGQWG